MSDQSLSSDSVKFSDIFVDQVLFGGEMCYLQPAIVEEGLDRWRRTNVFQQVRNNQVKMRIPLSNSIYLWSLRDWPARRALIGDYERYAHNLNDGTEKFNHLIKSFNLSKCDPIVLEQEAGVYRVLDGVHRLAVLSEVLGWVDLSADRFRLRGDTASFSKGSVIQPVMRLSVICQLDRLVRNAYQGSHSRLTGGLRGFAKNFDSSMSLKVALEELSRAAQTQELVVLEHYATRIQGYLLSPQSLGPIDAGNGRGDVDSVAWHESRGSRNRKCARSIAMQLGFEEPLNSFLGSFQTQQEVAVFVREPGPQLSKLIMYLVAQGRPLIIVLKAASSAAQVVEDAINLCETLSQSNAMWPRPSIVYV